MKRSAPSDPSKKGKETQHVKAVVPFCPSDHILLVGEGQYFDGKGVGIYLELHHYFSSRFGRTIFVAGRANCFSASAFISELSCTMAESLFPSFLLIYVTGSSDLVTGLLWYPS